MLILAELIWSHFVDYSGRAGIRFRVGPEAPGSTRIRAEVRESD